MTQKNLKSNIVVKQRTAVKTVQLTAQSNTVQHTKFNNTLKTSAAEKSALKNNNSIQNKEQKSFEIWDDLDTIPPRPEYPNNLPVDNIEAALYLTNLNQ